MGNANNGAKPSSTDGTTPPTTETNVASTPSTTAVVTDTTPAETVTHAKNIDDTPKTSAITTPVATVTMTPGTTAVSNVIATTSSPTTTLNTITSTSPIANNNSIIPNSTEGTSKPTLYSVVQSLKSNDDNYKPSPVKKATKHWYNWRKFEDVQRDKGTLSWYSNTDAINTDKLNLSATKPSEKTGLAQNNVHNDPNITAVPTFQLRSTAVYSPPHGDRFLPGRNESIDPTSADYNLKYYKPVYRQQEPTNDHTKATMYKMNTSSNQHPPLSQPSQVASEVTAPEIVTKATTSATGDTPTVRTFVSRALQTDIETVKTTPSSTAVHYYEKQPSQFIPASAFPNYKPNNDGFLHMGSGDPNSQRIRSFPQTQSVLSNDQSYPSGFERRPILINDPFYLPSERRALSVDSQLSPFLGRRQEVSTDPVYLPYERRILPAYSQSYPVFDRRSFPVDDSLYSYHDGRPVYVQNSPYVSYARRPIIVTDSSYLPHDARPVFVDDPLYPLYQRKPQLTNEPLYVIPERVTVPTNVQSYPVYERRLGPITSHSFPVYDRQSFLVNEPYYTTSDRELVSVNNQLQPVVETNPVLTNGRIYESKGSLLSSQLPASSDRPMLRPSILKKPSTSLSQDTSNPLSSPAHEEILERLRKTNNSTADGMYRVKKVHILEKDGHTNYQSAATFNHPSSKASQSILRSEALFSSPLVNIKNR